MFGSASFLRVSAYVDNKVLAAATAETITKPGGYTSAIITADAECWIKRGGTAAEPAADVADGTGGILLPANVPRIVDFTDAPGSVLASISIISTAGGNVSIEWFR